MAFLASQVCHLLVHHVHKPGTASANVFRQGIGRLVGGLEKHHIKAFTDAQHIPLFQGQLVAAS